MLDQFTVDDIVKVSFNLRGRKWEKDGQISYFTNLEAWRIEKTQSETGNPVIDPQVQKSVPDQDAPFPSNPPENDSGDDDLPF